MDDKPLNLERLMKLRLVVARHGEMDLAGWWNTSGMLSRRGQVVLKRGFPSTHFFAQARVVFEVARSRCRELFALPGAVTLWELPAELEDQFSDRWQEWLDDLDAWSPLFEKLAKLDGSDLLAVLADFDLISDKEQQAITRLKRSHEGRAVQLSGKQLDDELVTLLAAGFARGEKGQPAIPFARLEA